MTDALGAVHLPIGQLSRLLDTGELTAAALTAACLSRAGEEGRRLNAFVRLLGDTAVQAAEASDRRRAAGRARGPLDGIPIALKDNIDVAGVPTTAGFGGAPGPALEDAEVVRRLRRNGAVILGKTNMQEGALGSSGENAHHGRVLNPYGESRSPGGSSSGSGAAVAAGLCAAALGTDSGGSVRIPAAWCGLVGYKASRGLASIRGIVPLSLVLDHVGPLTRTVEDARLVIVAMQGFDPRCVESCRQPAVPERADRPSGLDGRRMGVLRDFEQEPATPAVDAAFARAVRVAADLGAEIVDARLPGYDLVAGRRAGFLRVEVEAAYHHRAAFEAEPSRFSPEMRGYIEYGLNASAQQLVRADRRIAAAAFALTRCFDKADFLLSPTVPQTANRYGDVPPENAGTYTMPANFAGCPAITLPMGRDEAGLPIGLQIMAPVGRDDALLRAAAAMEAALDAAMA